MQPPHTLTKQHPALQGLPSRIIIIIFLYPPVDLPLPNILAFPPWKHIMCVKELRYAKQFKPGPCTLEKKAYR